MPAALKVGTSYFFFTSIASAAKVADLLSKATLVNRVYEDFPKPESFTELADDYHDSIEILITKQRKPRSGRKALPEKVNSNNDYHQK